MKLKRYIYGVALLGFMGLGACTSEETDALNGGAEGGIPLEITVSRGNADTRATLTEGEAGLENNWEPGDKIYVVNASTGDKVGYLTLDSFPNDADHSTAVFKGTGTSLSEATQYTVWYMGKDGDDTSSSGSYAKFDTFTNSEGTRNAVKVDFSNQSGAFNDLEKGNLMCSTSPMTLFYDGEKYSNTADVTMKNLLAMAHFKLNGEETDKGRLVITSNNNNANGLYYTEYFSMADGTMLNQTASNADKIILNGKKDSDGVAQGIKGNDDVYVVLPVLENNATKALTFNLYTTTGDVCTFTTGENKIEAGKYYSQAKGQGLSINIQKLTVDRDPKLNPLYKWAEANLERDGNSGDSQFTSHVITGTGAEYKPGSLYQWGRNKGWKDYLEARGTLNSQYDYQYYITNLIGENTVYGNGIYKAYDNGIEIHYPQMIEKTNNDFDEKIKERWIMNVSLSNSQGDYWIGTHNHTEWSTRAKNCGFGEKTPAPNGYRLPMKADFQLICPEENIESSDYLSDILNNYIEKRNYTLNSKNIYYGILWNCEDKGIRIKSIVLNESFDKDCMDVINWNISDKSKPINNFVEERFFPYTGVIKSLTAFVTANNSLTGNTKWYVPQLEQSIYIHGWCNYYANVWPLCDIIVSPANFVYFVASFCENQYSKHYCVYKTETLNIVPGSENNNKLVGGYRMSDSTEVFYFNTNEGWYQSSEGASSSGRQTSRFLIGSADPTNPNSFGRIDNGYAIRCIDTSKEPKTTE